MRNKVREKMLTPSPSSSENDQTVSVPEDMTSLDDDCAQLSLRQKTGSSLVSLLLTRH